MLSDCKGPFIPLMEAIESNSPGLKKKRKEKVKNLNVKLTSNYFKTVLHISIFPY